MTSVLNCLYNHKFLWRIGAALGTMLKIDTRTSLHSRGRYARICIEIDLRQKLVPKVKILGHELRAWIQLLIWVKFMGQFIKFCIGLFIFLAHSLDNGSSPIRTIQWCCRSQFEPHLQTLWVLISKTAISARSLKGRIIALLHCLISQTNLP